MIAFARTVEKDTIALVPDLRKKAGFRGIDRIRDIKPRGCLAPPPNTRGIEHDTLVEIIRHVAKMMLVKNLQRTIENNQL